MSELVGRGNGSIPVGWVGLGGEDVAGGARNPTPCRVCRLGFYAWIYWGELPGFSCG